MDLGKATTDITNKFSNDDLSHVINSHAGPTDPFKDPNGPTQDNPSGMLQTYGPAAQVAAKAALAKIAQFGQGYYPGVDKNWVDAVTRMAAGQY